MSIKRNNEIIAGRYKQQIIPYASNTVAGIIRIATDAEITVAPSSTTAVVPTQLNTQLATKQNTLTAGSNIQISNDTISATDTTYTAGNGLTLTGTEFTANIEDNLTSTSSTNSLSAKQGNVLNTNIENHKADKNNPHEVTKTQVGLGNCDNTSDTNKPISTATQNALNAKQDNLTAGTDINITNNTISFSNDTGYITNTVNNLTNYTKTSDLGDLALLDTVNYETQVTNKPTIPTVNDATLTIQKNGTTIDTFTANSSTNKTINVTVPTQASDINALPNTTKYGADLSYSNSSLQLKDQDGNALGNAVTIESSPAIDNTTITKNASQQLQAGSLVGLTSTVSELNYTEGVTSNIQTQLDGKQSTLVSGTNIKTINNTTLLGSGNIDIQATPDDETISLNSSDELQAIGVIDSRDSSTALKYWTGTSAQYEAITTKDSNTLYNITDDTDITLTLLQTLYPVGSVYFTQNSTCPLSALFGTWMLQSSTKLVTNVDTTASVKGNGITLGLTDGTNNYGARIYSYQISGLGGSYGTDLPSSSSTGSYISDGKNVGITTDATKSGIEATVTSTTINMNIFVRTA